MFTIYASLDWNYTLFYGSIFRKFKQKIHMLSLVFQFHGIWECFFANALSFENEKQRFSLKAL